VPSKVIVIGAGIGGLTAALALRLRGIDVEVYASRRIGPAFQIESPILCNLRNVVIRMTPPAMSYRSLAGVAGYEGHLDREIKS
jgi:glycine/D-amino acid oxidase-like deaminating enzyme